MGDHAGEPRPDRRVLVTIAANLPSSNAGEESSAQRQLHGAGRFVAFLFSNFLQKTGQLFLLVGLAYLGTTQDVYRFGLFISLFGLIVPLLSLNMHMSIGRISFDIADERERCSYILSCLLSSLATVAVGLVAVGLCLKGAEYRDALTDGRLQHYAMVFVAMLLFVSSQFFTVLVRLEDRARPFVIYGAVIGGGALIVFIVAHSLGVDPFLAAVAGYSGAQLLAIIYGYVATKHVMRLAVPSGRYLRAGFAYGAGTVVFAVAQSTINYSGRWMAGGWFNAADLAAYTLMGQFIVALTMTLSTLYEANRPAIMRDFAAGDIVSAMRKVDRSFRLSLMLVACIFLIIFASYPIWSGTLPEGFKIQFSWLGSALLQSIAYSISMRIYWSAIGVRKTMIFGMASVMGAATCIGGTLLLGPAIGLDGMLLAASFGLLMQAWIANIFLRQYLRVSDREETGEYPKRYRSRWLERKRRANG